MSYCTLCARGAAMVSSKATTHMSGGVAYFVPLHVGRGAPYCRDERRWMRRDVVYAIHEARRLMGCADIDSETIRSDDTIDCLVGARRLLWSIDV